ncbi:MAG: hypothetical protein M1348_03465 [Candidatus Parvarchaeota archaeon]|nr:hypothetical protein [Candidatus Parvarchaeota archaeon]
MKGQGLPITAVILIILAIMILVLALIFIILPILGFGSPSPPNTSMTSFAFNCQTSYCGQPSNGASNNNNRFDTKFCTAQITYQGKIYNCYSSYSSKVIATCSYTADNGTYFQNITC